MQLSFPRRINRHRWQPWAPAAESGCAPACKARSAHASPFFPCHRWPRTEGAVLAGEAEARAEAIVVSGEMLRDLGGTFWQVRLEAKPATRFALSRFRLTAPSTRAEPKRWNASFWR